MKCPYCHKNGVKPPKKNEVRPHGHCPNCYRRPRASVSIVDGIQTVTKYSRESTPRKDRDSIKSKRYQLMLSKQDEADIENGVKHIKLIKSKRGKTLVVLLVV